MKQIRAIFIGDVRFVQCPVFELNNETNFFEMLIDKEMKYEKEVVEEDDDFLIFEIEKDIVTLIEQWSRFFKWYTRVDKEVNLCNLVEEAGESGKTSK